MWCELLKVGEQFLGYVLKVNDSLDVENCLSLFRQYMLVNITLETLFEGGDIFHLHRQACGIGVSTKVIQEIATALDGIIDVETGNRAGRASGHTVVDCHHDGGTEIYFRYSRGHDADYAFFPSRVIQHY